MRELQRRMLSALFAEALPQVDKLLGAAAISARGDDEQQIFFDAMRAVRANAGGIAKAFEEAIEFASDSTAGQASGAADVDDMSAWALQDGDALEERITVGSLKDKARAQTQAEVGELELRLIALARQPGTRQDAASEYSIDRVIDAMLAAMRTVATTFPMRLAVSQMLEQTFVNRLVEVYAASNQLLSVNGIEPAEQTRPRHTGVGATAAQGSQSVPAWATGLGATTLHGFLGAAGSAEPVGAQVGGGAMSATARGGYGEQGFAADVAGILQAYAQGQRPQSMPWMPAENVALVARMFDRFYADPRLSGQARPLIARLQAPILKTALADGGFFSQSGHPARAAVNDLVAMLRQLGEQDIEKSDIASLVDEVGSAYNLSPELLREKTVSPVTEEIAEAFLQDQDSASRRHGAARMERIRHVVSHELRSRTGTGKMPRGLLMMVVSGFAPLLCMDYLKGGTTGSAWSATMQLLDSAIDAVYGAGTTRVALSAEREAVQRAIGARLRTIGFGHKRIEELVQGLADAFAEQDRVGGGQEQGAANGESATSDSVDDAPAESRAPERLRPTPAQELQGLMSILMVSGTWYTLRDGASATKMWVRARSYYAARNSVTLGHYMEERFISLPASTFASALVDGRCAPIDPSPELGRAVDRLGALQLPPTPLRLVWTDALGRDLAQAGAEVAH